MQALILFLASLFVANPITYTKPGSENAEIHTLNGKATYYARYFEGHRTTNGERYRHKKFTAAHRTLPFGTIVTVTNLNNGKSVDVKVNDRGPHNKRFLIDLSQYAAREIGIYGQGVGNVEISYRLPE